MNIEDWILDVLSVAHPAFGNMAPCPYAKKALLDGNVTILTAGHDFPELFKVHEETISKNEVVVFVFHAETITPAELTSYAKKYSSQDIMLLEDHPDVVEEVDGFCVNQGTYACIFMSRRYDIMAARAHLSTTDYYDNWDEDYKKEVWSR